MRLLYSWQASLSAQTPRTEKTVDTHKIQFPLHHAEAHRSFLGVMLNLVEPSVTPPNMVSWYSAAAAEEASCALTYRMQRIQKRDKVSFIWQCITHDLLIFTVNSGHTYSPNQTSLCFPTATPDVHVIIKCSLHTPSEDWLCFPAETYEAWIAARSSSKVRGKFSCLHCKLQINFLCCAEHTVQARFLRQCTWASSLRTMWNKALQSEVGDVVDGYLEKGKKSSWFPQLCLILGSHYGGMGFQ